MEFFKRNIKIIEWWLLNPLYCNNLLQMLLISENKTRPDGKLILFRATNFIANLPWWQVVQIVKLHHWLQNTCSQSKGGGVNCGPCYIQVRKLILAIIWLIY
jgi:hypothetical protein